MSDEKILPVGVVTSWLSGGTPNRAIPSYWGGSIPWISAATLKKSRIDDSDQYLTEQGVRAGSKMAPVGSTLVLVRGMALRRETRIGLTTRPVSFNQDVKALVPSEELLPEFLLYSLQSRSAQILDLVSTAGSGTGVLNTEMLQRLPIWLPRQHVQRKIVSALTDVDELLLALERLMAKKWAAKEALAQRLLTGNQRLPGFADNWKPVRLGQLGTFLKGRGVRRDDVRPSGISCIRYGEIYTVFGDYTARAKSFVNPDVASTALPVCPGDLLFAGSGETRAEIGKCVAYVGETPAVAGGDIVVFRGENYNPVYMSTLMNSPSVVDQKSRAGQGDAIVHIHSGALANIKISLPPVDEQQAIAQVLLDADEEITALRSRLAKARAVKTGMMQELLTGRTRLSTSGSAA